MSEKKRLTIFSHPIIWLRVWYTVHILALQNSGDWFGISLSWDGKIETHNQMVEDFFDNLEWEEEPNV